MRQLIASAYVVRGFHLFREGERYLHKQVAVEQSAATLFFMRMGELPIIVRLLSVNRKVLVLLLTKQKKNARRDKRSYFQEGIAKIREV